MDRGNRVRVDEESVLARFADWHARIKGRPVAALGPETQDAALFVADEVIIDGDDHDLAEELKARYGAEVIPEDPLPLPPAGLHIERPIELEAMPHVMRLRFAAPPRIDGVMRLLEQAVEDRSTSKHDVIVTSELGAAVAAVAERYALEGHSIGLNLFGKTTAMPLATAQEGPINGAGNDPFTWPAFAGRTRIVDAWQLVESIRKVRGNRFTTIGILDTGFWLDNNGMPSVPDGQASDFGGGAMQLNLENEGQPAGGRSPKGFEWHGNAVASAAAAAVNNFVGAAGSGGTVAFPMFFRTGITVNDFLRCVRVCTAWRIDVLNMSVSITILPEISFNTRVWDKTFQFAFENGLVMIAAAGNHTQNLPDDENRRPATRTPGVLTVGALDGNDDAATFSNYGSSVWLWAPGTDIPVAPDPSSLPPVSGVHEGHLVWGTSFAAPIVAGVAAMMRFANPSLSAPDIRRILTETGWDGTSRPKVSKGLDAYAAVFAAINQALPDTDEPNNKPADARELISYTGPGGALTPGINPFTSHSSSADPDYWKFRVDKFSTVTVSVDWYQRLSSLHVALKALRAEDLGSEDTNVRGPSEMMQTGSPKSRPFVLTGLLPPGIYHIIVSGTGATAYRLQVTLMPAPLAPDMFEPNDSFAQATRLACEATKWTPFGMLTWGPGSYDATLHRVRVPTLNGTSGLMMNDDYFRLLVPAINVLNRPFISIQSIDAQVNVTLYDGRQEVIQNWSNVRDMTAYPPENSTCFLSVSGNVETRYRISTGMRVDPRAIPGPLQEELEVLPKWWGDPPPLRFKDIVKHYVVQVNENRGDGEAIAFAQPAEAVRVALLSPSGEVVQEGQAENGHISIDTRGIERGSYVLRISRSEERKSSYVELRTIPPLR